MQLWLLFKDLQTDRQTDKVSTVTLIGLGVEGNISSDTKVVVSELAHDASIRYTEHYKTVL